MNTVDLIKKINDLDALPAPYEEGAPMWTDPYISTHMLAAHLDESNDLASYRPQRREKVVKTIIDSCQLEKGSQLLDLGCGPGLYAPLFASKGIHYTGIDFSAQSLGYALAHRTPNEEYITYRQLDYTGLDYADRFDCASMVWCDFGALSAEMRDKTLRGIYKSLKPGGYFAFDVMSYDAPKRMETGGRWEAREGGFWHPGYHLLLERMVYYENPGLWLYQAIVATEDDVKRYRVWDKRYSRNELETVLKSAGFSIICIEDGGLSGEHTGFFRVIIKK